MEFDHKDITTASLPLPLFHNKHLTVRSIFMEEKTLILSTFKLTPGGLLIKIILINFTEAWWPIGRVSDSGERGLPFDAHSCCRVVFIELDTFTSQKVYGNALVICNHGPHPRE